MNWLFVSSYRSDQERPEIDSLSRINADGSYFGGTVISLLRVARGLRQIGHKVDLNTPTLPEYDVMIVSIEPEMVRDFPSSLARRRFAWLHDVHHEQQLKECADLFDGAIAVSRFVAEAYSSAGIPILVSTNPVARPPVTGTRPAALSLSFAGMFHRRRNPHFAVEVLSYLQAGIDSPIPESTLTLYGSYSLWRPQQEIAGHNCDAAYLPMMERALEQISDGSVRFTGNVPNDELIGRLGSHHFLLAPADLDESCSMAAIEAQSAGTVVVASARGALPDTVGRGGLVLALEPRLWAERIADVFRSNWAEYSRAALSNFEERFRLDRVIGEWIEFVLGQRRGIALGSRNWKCWDGNRPGPGRINN